MPFFSFSINEIKLPIRKFNITVNKTYFSKNTELWKLLKKQHKSTINFLKHEKRVKIENTGKKILFFLPPSIGLGDAIEYASAIKKISESINFDLIGIAFTEGYKFIFENYFELKNTYQYIINSNEINKFDTLFHVSLEIKAFLNQKYSRSNIFDELVNHFNIKDTKYFKNETQKKMKIRKISIFPLSSSPIRTMPIKILNELINIIEKKYLIEIFLDHNSEISNFLYDNISFKHASIVAPTNKFNLFSSIKNIEYGLFMDSGPLHIAKMFNKPGILLETSVSSKILLKNYHLIKGIKNEFLSTYCRAPCGLTDIFNYDNNYGCYDSLKIRSSMLKKIFKNMNNRGVKNYYIQKIKKPVGCTTSLNVQNIYNVIKKDLSL